jgi:CHAT domain-containing protein/tetratricopeptide (TPR) repeat protein
VRWLARIVGVALAIYALPPPASGVRAAAGAQAALPSPLPLAGAERELAHGDVHAYTVTLRAGDFLHLTVEQIGIDLAIELSDPAGKPLLRVDSPTGERGSEELFFVAAGAGRFRIEVIPLDTGASGRYRIEVPEIRRPTPRDRQRAAALAAFCRAVALSGRTEAAADAEAAFRDASRLWRAAGDLARWAESQRRLADLLAGRHANADALAIDRALVSAYRRLGDRRGEALAESAVGRCSLVLGQVAPALAAFSRALVEFRKLGDAGEIERTLRNLGEANRRAGDLGRALVFFRKELEAATTSVDRATALTSIGIVLSALGDESGAEESFQKAFVLLRVLSGTDGASQRAVALTQLGNTLIDTAAPRAALLPLQIALGLRRKLRERSGEAVTLASLSRVYYQLHDFGRAGELDLRALEIFAELGDRQDQATALNNLGWILTAQNRTSEALTAYRQAADLAAALGSREIREAALYGMARAERARRNLIAARRLAEQALGDLESIRSEAGSTDLQISFFEKKESAYGFLIDLLMEEHRLRPAADSDLDALVTSERARSRALLDRLAGPNAPTLPLEGIETSIPDDTLLLEYYLSEPHSVLWAVSRDSVASFELAGRTTLEAQVRLTLGALSRRGASDLVAHYRLIELGRSLLGPVAGRLGDERLLIVPHEFLYTVPFAALGDPADAPSGWVPLLERHEIATVPSVSVLAALRHRAGTRKRHGETLALIADPVVSADDPRLPPGARWTGETPVGGELQRLRFTAEEADALRRLWQPRPFREARGFDASRDRVLKDELGAADILHFATHGVFNEEQPERSGLMLSRFDRAGKPSTGLLRAQDIEKLHLGARLVVLSACQTALGRRTRGEGLVGLTQSFFAAGADRVLVSLWKVDDRATAVLMERFYREMAQNGEPPAAALRAAQRSLRRDKRWQAPSQWAGFLLQGDLD